MAINIINEERKDTIDVGSVVRCYNGDLSSYYELYMVVEDTGVKTYKLLNIKTGALIDVSYKSLKHLIQDYKLELCSNDIDITIKNPIKVIHHYN